MKKIGLVLFILSFWTFTYAQDETLEIITYYPAPYGGYNALKVGTTEADVAGITAPLQVGGASPVDTSIYAEQNSGAGYAGYFQGGVTGCIRLSSSGTIDRTHSGNGGLVFQNTDNPGNPNWKITRSSTNLFFHYGDNEQIHLTNGNHIHIPNGGITLEWTAPSALPNWEIARSFGNLMFYYSSNLRMFLESDGDLEITGAYRSPDADFAEMMRFKENIRELEPGDVVCINKEINNTLQKTDRPYLTNIAGVISEKPAVLGNQFLKEFGAQDETNEDNNSLIDEENNALPVAIVGIVKTKVSCENGAINPGDLITTSSTPGYAMKANPIGEINGYPVYPQGCIIGRALESLSEGKGKILVLVSLT